MMSRMLHFGLVLFALSAGSAAAQEFPHEEVLFNCETCHASADRTEIEFDHDQTGFPLAVQHRAFGCKGCHDVADFGVVDQGRCQTCHEEGAESGGEDAPHEVVPFSCGVCHTSSAERPIDFDHDKTAFALEGRHEKASCKDCHNLADFSKTEGDCQTCHTDAHQARLYPECATCHTPTSWTVTDHNTAHANVPFQLMGAHVRLECGACHEREIYAEFSQLSSECVSCHRTDYQGTEEPAHTEFDFGTDCEGCHSPVAWHPSMLREHLGSFPIYSGEHAGEWDRCSACHVEQGNYSVFSCLDCHAHRQSEMDEEHENVEWYSYDTYMCLGCHPTGEAPEDNR